MIAVVTIGSVGIWLPICLEALIYNKVTFHNIPQNVTTYFVSLLFAGCIDYFISRIGQLNIAGLRSIFLNLVFIVLAGIGIVVGAILLNIFKHDVLSLIIGIIGVIISYRIWWLANNNNPNFADNVAEMGGNANNPLVNGNQ